MVSDLINLFHWLFLQVLGLVVLVFIDLIKWKLCFIGMNVVMGQKTIMKTPTTWGQSSMIVWPTFSIKRFYTRLDVVEITFYHQTHTRANGDLIHSACDPRSTSWMSTYASGVFHKLKEFIWTQLGLRYTVKQIYDKHKEIWCAWVNAGEQMTWDDFLWLQDITYLEQKHKKGTWCLHTNPMFSIQSWVCAHPNDVFYF